MGASVGGEETEARILPLFRLRRVLLYWELMLIHSSLQTWVKVETSQKFALEQRTKQTVEACQEKNISEDAIDSQAAFCYNLRLA